MTIRKKVISLLAAGAILASNTSLSVCLTGYAAEKTFYGPIHVVPNTVAIRKNDNDFCKNYPTEQTLKFFAARNERESGQIVIRSDKTIKGIEIITADLVRKSTGKSISSSNIEVFFEQYLYIKENAFLLTDMTGYQPDPLLPYDAAKAAGLNKLDNVDKGYNQGVWFTVTVPNDTEAGTYTGDFKIILDGRECTLPVSLTVYDFSMPEKTHSKTFFNDIQDDTKKDTTDMMVAMNMAGYTTDEFNARKNVKDLKDFCNKRGISTGWTGTGADLRWGVEFNKRITDYADSIYEYVTNNNSRVAYYNLEPDYTSATYCTQYETKYTNPDGKVETVFPFKKRIIGEKEQKFNFNLECLSNGGEFKAPAKKSDFDNIKANIDKQITEKYNSICSEFSMIKKVQSNTDILTANETAAIRFAVETFLYYEAKFYTGTLTGDDQLYNRSKDDYKNVCNQISKQGSLSESQLKALNSKCNLTNDEWIERLYWGLMAYGKDPDVLNLARSLTKFSQCRYSQYDWFKLDGNAKRRIPGFQTVLLAIAQKSVSTNTDLLQYAYYYSPQIDEAQATDFWGVYEALNAAYTLEQSKQAVESYINISGASDEFKEHLKTSLKNIRFIVTNSPVNGTQKAYKNGNFEKPDAPLYLSILYHGLGYLDLDLECLRNDYHKFTIYTDSENISRESIFNTVKKSDTREYSLKLPKNFKLDCFCPLFNDFSTMKSKVNENVGWEGEAKDYDAAIDALHRSDINLWWYSCMSHANAAVAGYNIAGNSLAVARANKWQQFRMGIEGELYWAVDDYKDIEGADGKNKVIWENKANAKLIWEKTPDFSYGNDGILVYPMYALLNSYNAANLVTSGKCERFASSIRLENISEAIDDYDYLYLAEQAIMMQNDVNKESYRRKLDSIIASIIVPENVDYTNTKLTNSANIAKAKNSLAELIVECTSNFVNRKTNYTAWLVDNRLPEIKKWKESEKTLCFDVRETDTNQSNNRTASFALMDASWKRLSEFIEIDFASKTISNSKTRCPSATMTAGDDGWYTVQIPLRDVALKATSDKSVNGSETLSGVHFKGDYVNTSFMIDNFKVYQEVTNKYIGNFSNQFFLKEYGASPFSKWKTSGNTVNTLCFDVRETNTYHNSNGSRKVTLFLMSNWKRLNQLIEIDFAANTITNCPGAKMIPQKNSWYTIQIPIKNVKMNTPDVNGSETLDGFHFKDSYVNTSFLVDNIRVASIPYTFLDETTGILYLEGDVSKEDVQAYANNKNVKSVVARKGCVFSADISGLFKNFITAVDIDLAQADTSKVTNMSQMFYNCTALASLKFGANFNTRNVTNMNSMFKGCSSLTNIDLSYFNTAKVTNMSSMFNDCSKLINLDFSKFNTAKVTNMSYMFSGCISLNYGYNFVDRFNTEKVTNMSYMFNDCKTLTYLSFGSGFNTKNVTSMSYMFNGCTKLANMSVNQFNTAKVNDMSSMFKGCTAFTSLNIKGFNTAKVTNMNNMFNSCKALKKITVGSSWSTSNVMNSSGMFSGCTALKGGNGTVYSQNKTDKTYARIDKSGSKGYLTAG